MPSLIGPWISAGDTTVVDSALKHELGSRAFDANGNEYIYLTGVASTVAGYAVTFDEAHLTTLTVADAVGRVAFAMAAIDSTSEYGWYLIYGTITNASAAGPILTDTPLTLCASPGMLADTPVTGDIIIGCISRNAPSLAASPLTIEVNYPFVCRATQL